MQHPLFHFAFDAPILRRKAALAETSARFDLPSGSRAVHFLRLERPPAHPVVVLKLEDARVVRGEILGGVPHRRPGGQNGAGVELSKDAVQHSPWARDEQGKRNLTFKTE